MLILKNEFIIKIKFLHDKEVRKRFEETEFGLLVIGQTCFCSLHPLYIYFIYLFII